MDEPDVGAREHVLCPVDELIDGEPRRFAVHGRLVAVVRLDDSVYAIGDTCSHADYSLSEGEVDRDDCTLECPKHGSRFSLATGEPDALPATRPVPAYTVEVRDGVAVLLVDDEVAS